ncbi:putative transporter [Caulifigura coniformis]|uniref:Putative transporter n=1 Tax=Caulifigura coniformis TaxID=2527983 RepID=A0A517SB43_9PLAN|nr:MFS transporter [Caulifigura coniformis]QDT53335.1 putative transporter [Caulifigura coniformis]
MQNHQATERARTPPLLLIILAYTGFVSLGLPDAVIGVAWPSVRDRFGLQQGTVGFLFIATSASYFVSSFFAGRLTRRLGIGLLLAASTGLVASAMFGFAVAPAWLLFLSSALLHGLGSGAIDAGLNGYAAHSLSARHMNWLHACYCLGAMLGPFLMTAVLSGGRPYQLGYIVVGSTLGTLALLFLMTREKWGTAKAEDHPHDAVSSWSALSNLSVLMSMAVFFLNTGLEATFSQWTYTVLTESRRVDPAVAGVAVGLFWGFLGMGRVVFGLVADRLGIDRLLRWSLTGAAIGAVVFALPLGAGGAYFGLALGGLGLAPVFPCLMTRTPQRLGTRLSAHAVGFQVGAAMIGAAAVPGVVGFIAQTLGLAVVPAAIIGIAGADLLCHELLVRRTGLASAAPSPVS